MLVFIPSPFLLNADDYYVFTEYGWFDSDWAWLKHMLSFNQTRFTFTGDYLLFRPGLFFMMGANDILWREATDLLIFEWLLICALALWVLYRACALFTPHWLAALLALSLTSLIPANAHVSFHWSTAVFYMICLGLFTQGALWLGRSDGQGPSRPVLGILALFFASLFHELAIPALIGMIGYHAARGALGSNPVGSTLKPLLILTAPIALYAVFYLINAFYYDANAIFSLQFEPSAVRDGDDRTLVEKLTLAGRYLYGVLTMMIPSAIWSEWKAALMPDSMLKLTRAGETLACVALALWALGRVLRRHGWRSVFAHTHWVERAAQIALASTFAGVLVGRIISRGHATSMYYTMYLYFFLIIVAALLGRWLAHSSPRKRRRILIGVGLYLALPLLFNAPLIKQRFSAEAKSSGTLALMDMAQRIRGHQAQQDEGKARCFGGVFLEFPEQESEQDTMVLESLMTLFQPRSCDRNEDKPVYYIMKRSPESGELMLGEYNPLSFWFSPNSGGALHKEPLAPMTALAPERLRGLFWGPGGGVIKQEKRPDWDKLEALHLDGAEIEISAGTRGVSFQVESQDAFPLFYNFGLLLESKSGERLVAQWGDNRIHVAQFTAEGGEPFREREYYVPYMKSKTRVSVKQRAEDRCLLEMGRVIIASIPQCHLTGRMTLFRWDGADQKETLSDVWSNE
ncbi:hypothetical protein [Magnetofaba australis]|uniref:hypothetical protein n=1 Tax=Magnetofaba australis TaxID=1472297 RepID=UPI00117ED388|nr:hypothetical protein [Magnetofaba australis]